MGTGLRATLAAACAVVALVATASCVPGATPPAVDGTPGGPGADPAWLTAVRGPDAGIYDEFGRQVVLRGANLNELGDYFSSDPRLPTTSPLTEDDWADLAAQGADVVRLVTTWSAWQPQRGTLDAAYLARVDAAVDAARRHGMHVVLDMHQDAWSKFVFTPATETCPAGTHHQIGWDGAPAWATFTDGRPTCTPASREESPAVIAAWDNFYANRDGVRTELSALWGRLATHYANDPTIAGFDLLNEPGSGSDNDGTIAGLAAFYREAIEHIRSAERAAGARGHIVFFENTVHGAFVPFDVSDDPNIVLSPHNYAESIGPQIPGLMDLLFGVLAVERAGYGTATWTGEYGFFGNDDAAKMARYAPLDDATLGNGGAGGTWWQWEQECGDPHDVSGAYPPDESWIFAQMTRCGSSRSDLVCSTRAYPRAVPGRLTSVVAPCAGGLHVTGVTPTPSVADLWYPSPPGSPSGSPPTVTGTGLGPVEATRVAGGWRLAVEVTGAYVLDVA
ncbi:MAG: cellulase family glycosylhydrolase [Acidimicrobiales bacterium]